MPEILAEWESVIGEEEPWSRLRPEARVDQLPDVIVGIAAASLSDPASVETHRQKVEAAIRHGEDRRARGMSGDVLFTEYYYIRGALWRFLQKSEPRHRERTKIIGRLDTATMVASRASFAGYHRPELEARGRWEEIVEQLVRESPFLEAED